MWEMRNYGLFQQLGSSSALLWPESSLQPWQPLPGGTWRYCGGLKETPHATRTCVPRVGPFTALSKTPILVMHHWNSPHPQLPHTQLIPPSLLATLLHLTLEMHGRSLQQPEFSSVKSGGESCNGFTCAAMSCENMLDRIPYSVWCMSVCPKWWPKSIFNTHSQDVYNLF